MQLPPAARAFVTRCLAHDPVARPTMEEVLADPWLQQAGDAPRAHFADEWQAVAWPVPTGDVFVDEAFAGAQFPTRTVPRPVALPPAVATRPATPQVRLERARPRLVPAGCIMTPYLALLRSVSLHLAVARVMHAWRLQVSGQARQRRQAIPKAARALHGKPPPPIPLSTQQRAEARQARSEQAREGVEARVARIKRSRSPAARAPFGSASPRLPRLGSPVLGFAESEPRARHTDGQKAREWCGLLLRCWAVVEKIKGMMLRST